MNTTMAARVLAEANALKAQIAELEAQYRARTVILASLAGDQTGKFTVEGGSFTVSENNTYDEGKMRAALSPGQVRRCLVSRLDKPAVKRLYPGVYEGAKVRNGYKVSIG